MKTYLVGGAVRDTLLDYPVTERDWLVVGETPESMLNKGFRAVGKDFPVFLHPQTREEYALARTERKTAPGYRGFAVQTSPEVTLEEDLLRRDLTINAMAMTTAGELIDPYGGQQDLQNRVFRHVSLAFVEDPVRILRVARFAARYAHLGFTLADETRNLMAQMATNGETDHLVAERVWAELLKALREPSPAAFFSTLNDCGALQIVFPEIHALFGVPQPPRHHPEVDTGIHTLMVLQQAAKLTKKPEIRFAALLHDLGKAKTAPQYWPSHHGHEQKGLPCLEALCTRLRIPKTFKILAEHVMAYHTHCHRVRDLKASTLTDLLHTLGAFKSLAHLDDFLLACEADARGRSGFEDRDYPQADYLRNAAIVATAVDLSDIIQGPAEGAQIGAAIRKRRIEAVNAFIQHHHHSS